MSRSSTYSRLTPYSFPSHVSTCCCCCQKVRLWESVTARDRWYVGVLVVNGLFYAYFLLVEVVQWHQQGTGRYWADWLNCVQMLNVLLFSCQIAARFVTMRLRPAAIDASAASFYELNPAVRAHKAGVATMAVNVFLNWFKLIAYLSLNPTFAMMAHTLRTAAAGCCGFLGIFCIILYGFVNAGARGPVLSRNFCYSSLTPPLY